MNRPWLQRCMVGTVVAIALLLGGYGLLRLYRCEHDATAEQSIRRIIPLIEEYRSRTGSYPEHLGVVGQTYRGRKGILTFLRPPELQYEVTHNGYRIRFYQFPLGPFQGYDSRSKEWFCEE